MNDATSAAKDQIAEKLRGASNILVAVSMNPSIDQLSAAIAMTLLLNKLKKNATTVFSGKIPRAIDFLKPKDSIQRSTDSLRDFIIALDKNKADKLRYKVEDDVVKIFITPYRTSLSPRDFQYSAGDFNVDVILALGVLHQEDLDKAITAHGRIFHDAVVLGVNNTAGGNFGAANWEDSTASSLSELIAELAVSMDPAILDKQVATALLTGIVAETGRFSNGKTHPRTMQISSNLLAAGADQELVNVQLQDVVGQLIMPKAGSEIKPTVSPTEAAAEVSTAPEELVIGDNGEFKIKEAPVDNAAPAPAERKGPVDTVKPDLSAEELTPAHVVEEPTPEMAPEPAPEPITDSAPPAETPEIIDDGGAAAPADQDPSKQALADAFATLAPETPAAPPIPSPEPAPVGPPPMPQQSFAAPQDPSVAPQYSMTPPAMPAQEPAPLSMSPADQASTMPLPPSGPYAAPGSPPPMPSELPMQPQPGFGVPPPPAGPPPPPAPPPIVPTGFGQ
jgi:hypothetical protein